MFKEWQKVKVRNEDECIIQTHQRCCPIPSNQWCVAHYEKYVKESLGGANV